MASEMADTVYFANRNFRIQLRKLEISPNMNFAANNNKLQTIATQLLSMPYRSRTLGELI